METENNLLNWLIALRIACIDYHSGQWSRGYALGCALDRYFARTGTTPPRISGWHGFLDDFWVGYYYDEIKEKFGATL